MKQTLLSIIAVLITGIILQAQPRIFVDQSATGANDGSSWTDAYQDLQTALDDTSSPTIWVAKGIYVPGQGSMDTMSTYTVTRPVNIVGGFAGTEENPDERDTDLNQTTFSADLAGDDVFGSTDLNREDNAIHVMVIDSSAVAVTMDAVTITGGTNSGFSNDIELFFRAGAGIYSEATMTITDCDFVGNTGGSGSGLLLLGDDAAGSIVQNSNFYKNAASSQAAFMMLETSNIEVKDCEFYENQINRGALYPNDCDNVTITNCMFRDNQNLEGFGGAMFIWQSTNVDLVGSSFINNLAANAGAIYSDHRQISYDQQDSDNFLIQDCLFEGNRVSDWGGGAVRAASSSVHLLNTIFRKNEAANTGGAFVASNGPKNVLITDCTFEENVAGGGWGGGIAIYGDTTTAIVKNSTFKSNNAITSGGGATQAFGAEITYEDCKFESNTARFGAGMYSQDDYTSVTIKNTSFLTNVAEDNGGGTFFSGGQEVTIEDTQFEGNQANFGGGLGMSEDSLDLATLNLMNTVFNFNIADTQGGGVNLGNTNTNVTSCLFVNNVAKDIGTGGAMSTNSSGPNGMNISVMNSTFADNVGELGAGIVTWTADTSQAQLFIQNTALVNGAAINYAVEAGNTIVQSNGGNFSNSSAAAPIFTHAMDIDDSSDDPMFIDAFNFNYHISDNSPFVDAGVMDGAPMTDLDGEPRRNGAVDIGAYEYQWPVSNDNIAEDDINLTLTPNPAIFNTRLTVANDWTGQIKMDILDGSGKLIQNLILNKTSVIQDFNLEIGDLPKGVNYLVLKQNDKKISKRLLKL